LASRDWSFWRISFWSGTTVVIKVLSSFLTNKLFAVLLGPAGLAMIGQFQNLVAVGQAIGSGSLHSGWISLTTRLKEQPERLHGFWKAALIMTGCASLLVGCAALLLSPHLESLFSSSIGVRAALLLAIPGIWAAQFVIVCQAVTNGLGDMRRWTIISAIVPILQVIWLLTFLFVNAESALIALGTQSVLGCFFAGAVVWKTGFPLRALKRSVKASGYRTLLHYAAMGGVPMLFQPLVLMWIRSSLGKHFGWEAAGLWQGVWKISDFFSLGLSSVLGIYLLPRISRCTDLHDFRLALRNSIVWSMGAASVLAGGIWFFRETGIRLILDDTFLSIADSLGPQLVGDIFRTGAWCVGISMIARKQTVLFVVFEITFQLLFGGGAVLGIRFWGTSAPMASYCLENLLCFFIMLLVVWNRPWKPVLV